MLTGSFRAAGSKYLNLQKLDILDKNKRDGQSMDNSVAIFFHNFLFL